MSPFVPHELSNALGETPVDGRDILATLVFGVIGALHYRALTRHLPPCGTALSRR